MGGGKVSASELLFLLVSLSSASHSGTCAVQTLGSIYRPHHICTALRSSMEQYKSAFRNRDKTQGLLCQTIAEVPA
jgi:hypothetical protein